MNKKVFFMILPVCLLFCLGFTACAAAEASDPESGPDLWMQIRNTAWTKDGGKTMLGFYAPSKGPYANESYSADAVPYFVGAKIYNENESYIYDGNEGRYIINDDSVGSYSLKINRSGDKILYSWWDGTTYTAFKISVSGDTMTIKDPKNDWGMSGEEGGWSVGDDTYGTYTKISSDPNYKYFDVENGVRLWSQIRNTAWTKQGNSKPSLGFYENENGYSMEDGRIFLEMQSDTSKVVFDSSFPTSPNKYGGISLGGKSIRFGATLGIVVIDNGNTLIIDLRGRTQKDDNWNWGQEDYELDYLGMVFSDMNFSVDSNDTWVSNRDLRTYFNGRYTKTPNYNFNEDRDNKWEQIKNTKWTKQGETSPSIGFFEAEDDRYGNSNPVPQPSFTYYIKTGEYSSFTGRIRININGNGNKIRISNEVDWVSDGIYFDIDVSGNTLTLSNMRAYRGVWDEYQGGRVIEIFSGYFNQEFRYESEYPLPEWGEEYYHYYYTFEQIKSFEGVYPVKADYDGDRWWEL